MLGPVFNAEMLRAGRRGRAHILRWVYAGWLCLQLVYEFDQTHAPAGWAPPQRVTVSQSKADTDFGRRFRDLVLSQQFILIVLVTPAFVAGAITDEKTRGTLVGLLTAYVTPVDIVLGKLAARCSQVAVLALTPLPMLALVGQYAGITPEFLICLVAVTVLVLVGLGGLSMLASVWTRRTRDAVVATYLCIIGFWWLAHLAGSYGVAPAWLDYFDPLRPLPLALDRVDPAEAFRRVGQAAIVWGGLGLVTTTVAVWQLRPAYLRQLGTRPFRRFAAPLTSRPRPVRDVIAWKECYVGRRVPSWLGVPITIVIAAGITAYALSGIMVGWRGAVPYTLANSGFYALVLLTLAVGIRCSGAITGERERQTWDGLMTAPLTSREIVRGKLRGALRATWPYLMAVWLGAAAVAAFANTTDARGPLLLMLIGVGLAGLVHGFVRRSGRWVALGLVLWVACTGGLSVAVVVGVSIAATWLAMYFFGSVGLFCSARSNSSWRSLLGTVVIGYAGGTATFCVGLPIGCLGSVVLSIVVGAVQTIMGSTPSRGPSLFGAGPGFEEIWILSMGLGSMLLFWLIARSFLIGAENAVAKRDRIPPDWVRMIEYDLPRRAPYHSIRRVRR
jgi:ABC-type transport system involved in multi-copper enzyme maturation permease subunit